MTTTGPTTKHILVVEDEQDLSDLVALHLRDLGCEVTVASDGATGLAHARSGRYDLIVLDWMLPGVDGLEICRQVRQQPAYTPILMLTAKSSELDRVLGLEVGADDYLTKPFSVRELAARARAIFRRVEAIGQRNPETDILRSGALEIDRARRQASLAGTKLTLTAKEFDLLVHFARHPGRVYSRADLLDQVWGYGHGGYEHTVNSHINRLRAKIEADPAKPQTILTVWGVGYKLSESNDAT